MLIKCFLLVFVDVPGCGFLQPIETSWDFVCDARKAVIANLNYPDWHPTQRPTSWRITTSTGTYIALNFTRFDVQSFAKDCDNAYLRITSEESTYVFCNHNFLTYLPDKVYYSHRNSLMVEMTVEDGNNATFMATYVEINFLANELPSNEGEYNLLSLT